MCLPKPHSRSLWNELLVTEQFFWQVILIIFKGEGLHNDKGLQKHEHPSKQQKGKQLMKQLGHCSCWSPVSYVCFMPLLLASYKTKPGAWSALPFPPVPVAWEGGVPGRWSQLLPAFQKLKWFVFSGTHHHYRHCLHTGTRRIQKSKSKSINKFLD